MKSIEYRYTPPRDEIEFLYDDNDISIVIKPAGLLTVPGNVSRDSLVVRLKQKNLNYNPIHRLDTSTSGILLLSKNKRANQILSKYFSSRNVKKFYVAYVNGIIKNDYGAINYPMSRDLLAKSYTNAPIQKTDYVNGKLALTFYRVLSREEDLNRTLVLLEPHTGRTHQLRHHMKCINHSIEGDCLYGDGIVGERLKLHSCYLSFNHPTSGELVKVSNTPAFCSHVNLDLYFPE
jgi:tRNA pseudouridine32 synthase/23S rRNA pseudouridine746 synthase